jgi:hypothetical protein
MPELPRSRLAQGAPIGRDWAERLSLSELATRLGLSEEEIKRRETTNELFSIIWGRGSLRVYPAFQAWDCLAGGKLRHILLALGEPSGPAAYGFFTSPLDALCGLSPLQVLDGWSALPAIDEEAQHLLQAPDDARRAVVLQAARACCAVLRS